MRRAIARYFDDLGNNRRDFKELAAFLEEHVRPEHYRTLKLVAYLELTLYAAIPDSTLKKGLFELGREWSVSPSA